MARLSKGGRYRTGDESPNLPVAFSMFKDNWQMLCGVRHFQNHVLKLARRVARKMDREPDYFRSPSDLKGFLISLLGMARREFELEERKQGSSHWSVDTTGYGYGGDSEFHEVPAVCLHDFPVELSGNVSSYAKELVAERSLVTVDEIKKRFKVERSVAVRILAQVRMELEDELLGVQEHD